MDYETIAVTIIAAIIYAGSHYIKKALDGQKFISTKFLSTVALGAIIGVIFAYQETPITEEGFAVKFLAYGFMIPIIENIIKSLLRGEKIHLDNKNFVIAARIMDMLPSNSEASGNITLENGDVLPPNMLPLYETNDDTGSCNINEGGVT